MSDNKTDNKTDYEKGYEQGYADGPSWEEGTWGRSVSSLTGNESCEYERGYKDGWTKRLKEDN